jgi:O-acetyl-ADP-ribose deacetylase (regulator of RNase III)
MWSCGARGWTDEEYEAYTQQLQKERQERYARVLAQQAAIDNAQDPQEKLALQRKRYKCGENYVQVSDMQPWQERIVELAAAAAASAVANNAGASNPAQQNGADAGGGASWMFARRPALKFEATDLQARFPVDAALNAKVSLLRGDITSLEIDGIVNAANSSLMGGGGVDGAIHSAAGPLLESACRPLGGAETGETKVTAGFALPAKYILHTVGPVERGDRQLRSCYRTSLDLALKHGMRTVAFCCVSTGIYGFPLKRATHIALDETRKVMDSLKNGTYRMPPASDDDEDDDDETNGDGAETDAAASTEDSAAAAPAALVRPQPTLASIDRIIFCVFTAEEVQCYEGLLPSYFPIDGFPATRYDPTGADHDDFNRDDARPTYSYTGAGAV